MKKYTNYNKYYNNIVINNTYGKLKVLFEGTEKQNGCKTYWCRCKCGKTELIIGNSIAKGRRVACHRCQPKNFTTQKERNEYIRRYHISNTIKMW